MDSYEPTSESVARTTLEQRVRAAIPQAYEPEDAPAAIYTPGPIEAGDEITELEGSFEETEETGEEAGAVLELAEEQVEEVATPVEAEAAPAATFEDEPEGLYDCLAAARELAQTARSNEDRGRKALYQAVARAYDFSLEASANPEDFAELCAENGLTVQDRAPMTPVVKLVFGTDYDKTRLTEYATVLGYAHRTGIARGTLDKVLASAEGGLKGVVQAERAARKEAEGKPVAARSEVRKSLAKKLRKIEAIGFEELEAQGSEFALVMVRRLPTAELVVLGEVPEDLALVEKAAKKLLG